jgi:hypothetical protein
LELIFPEFLPPKNKRYTINFLFEHTRHTPRDIIQLLNEIQLHCKQGRVTKEAIFIGLRSYSNDYFVPEIRNQLNGFLSVEEIDNSIKLLSSIGTSHFSYNEIEQKKIMIKGFLLLISQKF